MKKMILKKATLILSIILTLFACSSDDEATDTATPSQYGFGVSNFQGTNLEFTDNTSHYFVANPTNGNYALTSVIRFSNSETRIEDCTTTGYVYTGSQTNESQVLTISLSAHLTYFINNDISYTYSALNYLFPGTLTPDQKGFQAVLAYKDINNQAIIKYNLTGSDITLEKINNYEYKISGQILFDSGLSITIPAGTIVDFDCIAPAPSQPLPITQANLQGKWQEELYRVNGVNDMNYFREFYLPCTNINPNVYYEFTGNQVNRHELFNKLKIEKIALNQNELTGLSSTAANRKYYIFGDFIYLWFHGVPGKNITNLGDWVKIYPSNFEEYYVVYGNGTNFSGNYTYDYNSDQWQLINQNITSTTTNCSAPAKVYNSTYTLNGNLLYVNAFNLNSNSNIELPFYRRSMYDASQIIYLDAATMRIKYTLNNIEYIVSYKRV